jgi:cytochrome c biogenesis protein ResB
MSPNQKTARYDVLRNLLAFFSSARLALVLIILVILLSVWGLVLPQEGMFEPGEISLWQEAHPAAAAVLEPLGLFHVFHSLLFLALILLLGINTLTCTVLRFNREGGFAALKGKGSIRRWGFLSLHIGLLILFAGGFWSASSRLDGYIILTEGQNFREEHSGYMRLAEGPLRREHHEGFVVRLNKVQVDYADKRYHIQTTASLDVLTIDGRKSEAVVRVNRPVHIQSLVFTLDDIGFSPRVMIREKENQKISLNSFIALKTFRTGKERQFRDFIPVSFSEQRVIVTLYPSYARIGNLLKKTGDLPEDPLLFIELENGSGEIVASGDVAFGEKIDLEGYTFGFEELRRWASFKIVEDPGYTLVWIAMWLGIGALLLRYLPDLRSWFRAPELGREGRDPLKKNGSL